MAILRVKITAITGTQPATSWRCHWEAGKKIQIKLQIQLPGPKDWERLERAAVKQKLLVWPGLAQESSLSSAKGMSDGEVHMDLASGKKACPPAYRAAPGTGRARPTPGLKLRPCGTVVGG